MNNENNEFDFEPLPPFKWFVQQNFPFIDADFDAITNYQLFCKLGEEINKIINSENTLGEQVELLTNAFNALKTYVDNYFDNLDVQEEIDKKLDKMVLDGTFDELIENVFAGYQEQIDEIVQNINNNYNVLDNKINVNQTNVLNQLASLSSGSPAGVYDDLDALNADSSANHSRIYITANNGHWAYYDTTSSEWVDGGAYLANEYIEGITPNQLSFIKQTTLNIFNNDNTTDLAEGLINTAGVIDSTQTNYYTTPFMPVVAGTLYYKKNNLAGAWYNADKERISGVSYGNTSATAPSNAKYFRTSLLKTDVASFYVSVDNRWSKYGFNPFYILDQNLTDLVQSLSNLKQKVLTPDTEFFDTTDTNIYNSWNITENSALSASGKINEAEGFFVTDFLRLPAKTGHIYTTASYQLLVYDSSYRIITVVSGNNTEKSFDLSGDATYVRTTFANANLNTAKILLDETVASYNARSKYVLQFRTTAQLLSIINQLVTNSTFQNNIRSIVEGTSLEKQKWCAIGDSWTEVNNTATTNYVTYLTNQLNLQTTNLGVSGTGFKRGYDNDNAYYQRTDSIPNNTDIITIMGSGNDLGAGYTLGNATDTGTTTICGCINTTLDNIFERFPGVRIGIISLAPWQNYPPNTSNTFANYTNALKTIAQNRGIPFLDLYHSSNLRPWEEDFRTTYMPDGVHPNDAGTLLFVNRIKQFISSL